MKILGLEASGIVASVALVCDDKLLGEYTINHKRTHSKTLMPMLEELLNRLEIDIGEIDAIATSSGPGSYTGLRISSSTAKGLAMALDKPIVSVPTMEGMAYNLFGAGSYICPIVDARRSQVYTGIYYCEADKMRSKMPQAVMTIDDLLQSILEMLDQAKPHESNEMLYRDITFLGDAVKLHRDLIIERLGDKAHFAPLHKNMPSAASIATLGAIYVREGKTETATEHRPIYLMLSEAEKERLDAGEDILEPSTVI